MVIMKKNKETKIKLLNNKKILFNNKGQITFLNIVSSIKLNKFYKCILKKSL
jgi:hypothetical protein